MTEQNTAYRTDLDPVEEEDPLAELARIVAGEPANQTEAPQAAEAEVPQISEVSANEVQAEADFDIENALMQELGESDLARASAPAPEVDVAPAVSEQPTPFASRATPIAPVDSHSLEDQLMAELSAARPQDAVNAPQETVDQSAAQADLVEEAVSNAVRDVEAANAEISAVAQDDPFAQVEQAASAVSQEVQADSVADDKLEDFFSDGFEDLLAEEVEASTANEIESAQAASVAASVDAEIDDLEDAFSAAFEAELAVEPAEVPVAAAPVAELHQDELALENEFAKSFASELGANDPIVNADASTNADFAVGAYANEPMGVDVPDAAPAHAEHMAEAAGDSGSSGGFKMAVGALGIALLLGMGVVGWGYYSGGGSTEPAIIKADAEPTKVKPENPGGEQIANQDNEVYNRVAGNATEEPKQEELITSRNETVAVPPKSDNRLTPDGGAESSGETAPLGISPKRVRTLTVKPDGTILPASQPITTALAAETASLSDSAATQIEQAVTATDATASNDSGSTIGIDGARTTGALAVPQPSPLPAPKPVVQTVSAPAPKPAVQQPAPKPAAPAQPAATTVDPNAPTQIASLDTQPAPKPTVSSSEWKIQVSSQRSREAAEASFTNLQRRFSSILGGRSAMIQRADIDGKGTFFRAKVLAESKADAAKVCSRLKSAGGSCFVTR